MAYVARVSCTSSSLLPRSYATVPSCCFVGQFSTSISAPIHIKSTSLFAFARASEQGQRQERPNSQRNQQQQQQQQPPRSRSSQPQPPQNRQYTTRRSAAPKLQRPDIIFSNNHLLVVNKPPGWKSQPGDGGGQRQGGDGPDRKCLLTYIKSQSLGGGSQKDFVTPTHRLDQPCTGVLIFAKNGKAASRVQVAWSKQKVKKEYWVMVEGNMPNRGGKMDGLELLRSRSIPVSGGNHNAKKNLYRLSAILQSTGGKGGNARGRRGNNAGGSVIAKPIPPNYSSDVAGNSKNGRVCHIEWERLLSIPGKTPTSNTRHLLSVTTDTGAKHQVRALLALAGGSPISGDLRYGNNPSSQFNNSNHNKYQQGTVDAPLPDGSVALHARSVFLPTVSLGGMEFLKDDPFVADVPTRWRDFFGIGEDDVRGL